MESDDSNKLFNLTDAWKHIIEQNRPYFDKHDAQASVVSPSQVTDGSVMTFLFDGKIVASARIRYTNKIIHSDNKLHVTIMLSNIVCTDEITKK